MRTITRALAAAAIAAAAAVAVAGCGSDGGSGTVDSGPTVDAQRGNPGFAGCTTFADMTAVGANRTITADGVNLVWNPKCIRIRQGQSVMISTTVDHPFTPAANNPGGELSSTTAPATRTLGTVGVYGFFCANHGTPSGGSMAGAIDVVP